MAWRTYLKSAASPTQSTYEVTRNQALVLVDTMVFLESHRVGSWRAISLILPQSFKQHFFQHLRETCTIISCI